jgi:hypothetical protein
MLRIIRTLRLAYLSPAGVVTAAEKRPRKIIFIMADDLDYADAGCFGGKKI